MFGIHQWSDDDSQTSAATPLVHTSNQMWCTASLSLGSGSSTTTVCVSKPLHQQLIDPKGFRSYLDFFIVSFLHFCKFPFWRPHYSKTETLGNAACSMFSFKSKHGATFGKRQHDKVPDRMSTVTTETSVTLPARERFHLVVAPGKEIPARTFHHRCSTLS